MEEKDSEESACESHQNKQEKISCGQKIFQCARCRKKLKNEESLHKHMAVHVTIKKFKCHVCSKDFSQKTHLNAHLKTHTGIREFKCHVCQSEFFEKSSLTRHLKKHNGEKEFKCHLCSKEFYEKSDLKKHLKKHDAMKEFKCRICSKEFHEKCDLRKHLKIHYGLKEFKCQVCSREFIEKSNLKKHIKTHIELEKFKCIFCSKGFRFLSELKDHTVAHPEEKGAVFQLPPFKSNQNEPSMVCSQLKEFKCHFCDDEFSDESYLQKHLLKHSDQMIDVQCSSSSKEDVDKTALKSDPDVDPLLIEDEISAAVEEVVPDLSLSEEASSMFSMKDLLENECAVKIENDAKSGVFQKYNNCNAEVDEIVKGEEVYDCDNEFP